MKKAVLRFCVLALSVSASEGFWARLPPEQRAKAGLENLSPEQRAAFDLLAAELATSEPGHVIAVAREGDRGGEA
ncbi:MAG: hypothetical protein KF715_07955 [Candidatus Didemnitutus sp.]|nr:hypothetical protein [Candidatus Didemnitutus sp.]